MSVINLSQVSVNVSKTQTLAVKYCSFCSIFKLTATKHFHVISCILKYVKKIAVDSSQRCHALLAWDRVGKQNIFGACNNFSLECTLLPSSGDIMQSHKMHKHEKGGKEGQTPISKTKSCLYLRMKYTYLQIANRNVQSCVTNRHYTGIILGFYRFLLGFPNFRPLEKTVSW